MAAVSMAAQQDDKLSDDEGDGYGMPQRVRVAHVNFAMIRPSFI